MAPKTPAIAPTSRRRRRGLVISVAIVLAGLAGFAGHRLWQHAVVNSHLPARPELHRFPPALRTEVDHANAVARGYLRPQTGLADLSGLYHANGFYEEAMQCYQGLRRLEPGAARWAHHHGSILASFGQLEEAQPLLQSAATQAPEYIPARLRLGDVLLKANRIPEAADTYGTVLEVESDNPYALLGLARCDLSAGDWEKARERLQRTIARHPDFIGALSLMVTVSEHFGDTNRAEALRTTIGRREFSDFPDPWIDELLDVCYDPYGLSVGAAVANFAGDPGRARQLLERAIALAPQSGSYRRHLGRLLYDTREYALARRHLEAAVAVSPADSDAWFLLVQTLGAIGDMDAAARAITAGLAHCPDSPSLHLEQARRMKAVDRREEAIAEYREAYRLRPSEATPLIEVASLYFAANRANEGVAALQEALAKEPEHPLALTTLMIYSISIGDQSGALAWWERVRRQSRTPPQMVETVRRAFAQRFGRNP